MLGFTEVALWQSRKSLLRWLIFCSKETCNKQNLRPLSWKQHNTKKKLIIANPNVHHTIIVLVTGEPTVYLNHFTERSTVSTTPFRKGYGHEWWSYQCRNKIYVVSVYLILPSMSLPCSCLCLHFMVSVTQKVIYVKCDVTPGENSILISWVIACFYFDYNRFKYLKKKSSHVTQVM